MSSWVRIWTPVLSCFIILFLLIKRNRISSQHKHWWAGRGASAVIVQLYFIFFSVFASCSHGLNCTSTPGKRETIDFPKALPESLLPNQECFCDSVSKWVVPLCQQFFSKKVYHYFLVKRWNSPWTCCSFVCLFVFFSLLLSQIYCWHPNPNALHLRGKSL